MQVIDIVKNSAKLLELNDVLECLNDSTIDETFEITSDIDNLLMSINIVCRDIASSFCEVIDSVKIECTDDLIKFSQITDKDILNIKSVKTFGDLKVDYQVKADGVHILPGCYVIEFSYLPKNVGRDDSIDFCEKIGLDVFSYGVVSEYLFLKGDIQSASVWGDKFKDLLWSICRTRKSINIPCKRWE